MADALLTVQTVGGVRAGHVVLVVVDQGVLDEVLDVLDLDGLDVALPDLLTHLVGDRLDLAALLRSDMGTDVGEGRLHGIDDVDGVEVHDPTVTLLHKHLAGLRLRLLDGAHPGLVTSVAIVTHVVDRRRGNGQALRLLQQLLVHRQSISFYRRIHPPYPSSRMRLLSDTTVRPHSHPSF